MFFKYLNTLVVLACLKNGRSYAPEVFRWTKVLRVLAFWVLCWDVCSRCVISVSCSVKWIMSWSYVHLNPTNYHHTDLGFSKPTWKGRSGIHIQYIHAWYIYPGWSCQIFSIFIPTWGKKQFWHILTNIFQLAWNDQIVPTLQLLSNLIKFR